MSLVPLGQARQIARENATLRAENDGLRRRLEALERERNWEAGYLTHVVAEMCRVIERWR